MTSWHACRVSCHFRGYLYCWHRPVDPSCFHFTFHYFVSPSVRQKSTWRVFLGRRIYCVLSSSSSDSASASTSGSIYCRSMRNVPARKRTAHTSLGRRSTTRPGSPTSTRSPRRNEDMASADFRNGGTRVTITAVPCRSGGDAQATKRGHTYGMLTRPKCSLTGENSRCLPPATEERIFGKENAGSSLHPSHQTQWLVIVNGPPNVDQFHSLLYLRCIRANLELQSCVCGHNRVFRGAQDARVASMQARCTVSYIERT